MAEALREGSLTVVEDLQGADGPAEYDEAQVAAFFPMENQGTISVGRTQPGPIGQFDRFLIEVLAAYAGAMLERIEQEEMLRKAKAEAEEASRMKSALLANMSHEIRTPLTSILGFAEEIGTMGQEAPGPVDRFAGLIQKSGHRLLETLDGVLNLSKLEAEEMELETEPIDLPSKARQVAQELRSQAEDAGLHLQVQTVDTPIRARADAGGVKIVVQNLLSNAIKYTEEGGQVYLRFRSEEDMVALEVEDTGIGMDQDQVERLFDPFRQASEGVSREYEGTGLGLAITQKAVEEMGGEIEVDTEKDVGSRFTVWLPKGTEPEAQSENQER